MKSQTTLAKVVISTVAVSALALAGCSNSQTDSTEKVETATSVAAPAEASAGATSEAAAVEGVAFANSYVRAMDEGAMMTAIFGELINNTDAEVQVQSFTATIDADSFELHEVVDGQMRMKEDGFTIPAGETLVLQPGHEHMMVMGVKTPVKAGETVDLTITLGDGTTVDVPEVPVRSVGAGDENYGDLESGEMGHTEHSEHAEHAGMSSEAPSM
ncbi:copper chaperone PCu(A)C [Corynebacterium sp. ZY180755]